MAKDILDAVYGCLAGGAVGDALGAPVEGWMFGEIREKYGKITAFHPMPWANGPKGKFTDDTTLRHYLCYAIVRKGGRVTPDDFARVWTEKLNNNRLWESEKITTIKLKRGMNPWDAGKGNIPVGSAVMAIAPIGIINAGNPSQAYQDGWNIASVNQDGDNRDFAATFAAATAAAFLPDATWESVVQAFFDYGSFIVKRAMTLTMDLAVASSSVDEFAEKFYAKLLDWTWPLPQWNKEKYVSGNSIEFVPVVPALLHLCKGDVEQCMIEGASFGRDCDTIASLAGNLAGALQGAGAIRPDWIEFVTRANEDFFVELEGDARADFLSMAKRLVEALKKERNATAGRMEQLDSILGS